MAQDSASAFLPRPWWMSAHFFHLALITLPAPSAPLQHSTERAQQAVKTVLESLERCPIFFFFFWKNAVANYCTSKRFCFECNRSSFSQQLAKKNTLSQFKILYMAKKAEQNETWRQCLQRNSLSAFINCCDLIARTERGKLALDGQTLGMRWGLDEKGVLRNVSKISLNNRRKSVILPRIFAFCAI